MVSESLSLNNLSFLTENQEKVNFFVDLSH